MQTLQMVLSLSHLIALHDALRENFRKVTNNEMWTAKRHWTSFTLALTSSNCRLCYWQRIVGRSVKFNERGRERGGG